MRYREMMAHPTRGITRVVDLTWDRRDRGGRWLVVERGHRVIDGHDEWPEAGRLLRTTDSARGARWVRTRAARRAATQALAGRYDVVLRSEVALTTSSVPYGCSAR